MLEFKIIKELKPKTEILEVIKNYTYKTKNGRVKHLIQTNLQFVEPTEYLIKKEERKEWLNYGDRLYKTLRLFVARFKDKRN